MASGSYSRIRLTFWTDPDVKHPLSAEQKTLLLYYFSSPHGNMIGLFHCPLAYVVEETGIPLEMVRDWTLNALSRFVSFDPRTEEILVHRAARHQIAEVLAKGDKRLKAVVSLLHGAHSKWLVRKFLELYPNWPLDVDKPEAAAPANGKQAPSKDHTKPLRSHSSAVAVQCNADSVSTETGAVAPSDFQHRAVESADEPPWNRVLMPILRECGFAADDRDGSILKGLVERGVTPDRIEPAIRGAAKLRDAGHLVEVLGVKPGDVLNMRMLVAEIKNEFRAQPLWREAEDLYFRELPKTSKGPARIQIGFTS